ncbi:cyclic AMP-dependent transcription factor ATF-4-like [Scyliorhinus canicula]|uniref:cyclic AMP-dependent transcription factor ATF-4-like n=1 Tax=Scyliorhinus canicula TaxID=7830 RepID=UPI0018F4DD8F|nr:cyclic AMP-dependent transcription factor ATF-4-like [Scyliorhinus canicula]
MSVSPDSFSSLMEDFVSFLDSPFLTADGDPCLLHADLEEAGPVKSCLRPLPFGSDEESDVSSQCPCVDSLLDTDNIVGDAFTGLDWMLEKVDFFDTLMVDENGSPSSEELLAVLDMDSSRDLLEELPFDSLPAKPQVADLGLSLDLEPVPNSPPGSDQLAPGTPTATPESLTFSPDDLFHFGVEKEVSVSDAEGLLQSWPLQDSSREVDEGPLLDSDSGVGSSPPHSPVESPDRTVSERSPQNSGSSLESVSEGSPQTSASSPGDCSPTRPKPYDRPSADSVGSLSKVKVSGEPRGTEKKLKKMEQNKSAATRYRQKKRAEHGAIVVECSVLEEKNKTLQEKADSLAKEIQYLKGLIEEVRKAKSSKNAKSL